MCLRPPVTSESLIWANETSMCTLPSHSVWFCAVTPLRVDSIDQEISLSFNEVERSKCNNLVSVVVIDLNLWTKITILSVPRRGKDWNYIALMWDYFEQPQRAAEGRQQVPGTRLYSAQENPSCPSTSEVFSFLLHFVTLTGRRAEECCALHHQVSVPTLPSAASCVWV